MLCIFHSDLDGHSAAAVLARRYPMCRFVEADYRRFPLKSIEDGEITFILDYSPPVDLWPKVLERSHKVVWIDHHGTAIEAFEKVENSLPDKVRGIRSTEHCGAWLTWQYCFTGVAVPYAIELIDQWDRHVFTPENEREVVNFARGMELHMQNPFRPLWELIFSCTKEQTATSVGTIHFFSQQGAIVVRYEQIQAAKDLQSAYPVDWQDKRCLACNTTMAGSRLFDADRQDTRYDIYICWNFDGENYTVHLYSETEDVGAIAKANKGGGHKGAAGFVCSRLPWE